MLYDFGELKLFVLKRLGVDADKVKSNFQPIVQKLTQAQLNQNVEFNTDGIFFVDKKGNKHKGFLYIEKGYTTPSPGEDGNPTIVPKFHVANCRTIEEQKLKVNFNGHYVFSTEVVKMEDIDGKTKEPFICKSCVKIYPNVYRGMITSAFREKVILNGKEEANFFESDLPKEVTTDFWGYTSEWDVASKNYRMAKRFTCEDCGINLNQNLASGYYLETHHISGNKLDNDDSNLKCLCVLCHANVDDHHQTNYSRGRSKQKLVEFIMLFEDDLKRVGNKYLSRYNR